MLSIQNKNGRMKPTHLMYKANLSYNQMNSYLEELLEKEFISKATEKSSTYILMTEKGFNFTQKIMEMKNFEKTFGL